MIVEAPTKNRLGKHWKNISAYQYKLGVRPILFGRCKGLKSQPETLMDIHFRLPSVERPCAVSAVNESVIFDAIRY